jgi:hypothetical protein
VAAVSIPNISVSTCSIAAQETTHPRGEPVDQTAHQARITIHCELTRAGLGRRLLMVGFPVLIFRDYYPISGRRNGAWSVVDRTAGVKNVCAREGAVQRAGSQDSRVGSAWGTGKPVLRQPLELEI